MLGASHRMPCACYTCFVFDLVVCPWTRLAVSILPFGLGVLLADIDHVFSGELQNTLDETVSSFTLKSRTGCKKTFLILIFP